MDKTTRATLIFLVLFIGMFVYFSMTIPRFECEICVTFQNETTCRAPASEMKEASIESAVTNACGTLASGMTESIRCQHTRSDCVTCRQR